MKHLNNNINNIYANDWGQRKIEPKVIERLKYVQKLVEQFPVTTDMFSTKPPIISWGVCSMATAEGVGLQKPQDKQEYLSD